MPERWPSWDRPSIIMKHFILGTCRRSYRSLLTRAAKVGAPITGFLGVASDMGAPIANFILWQTVAASGLTIVAGGLWFGLYQRRLRRDLAAGKLTQEDIERETGRNPWSVCFAFGLVSTLVLGAFLASQRLVDTGDKGVLATLVPALQEVQQSLLRIEKQVGAVGETTERIDTRTAAIADTTQKVLTKLEDLRSAFENAGKNAVLIDTPSTPAEHYFNARVYELKGDFLGARKSYSAYFSSGVEFIDTYLAYTELLKAQDGIEGAREIVTAMRKSNASASLAAAAAMLQPRTQRIPVLKQLLEDHPDFGPAAYLLSLEFSQEKMEDRTLSEIREEKNQLEKFRAFNNAGYFQRYMMDKRMAMKWVADMESRLATLDAGGDLKSPVTFGAFPVTKEPSGGWELHFYVWEKFKEMEYRLDGVGEFVQIALRDESAEIVVPKLAPGDHIVEVRYRDRRGTMCGPYALKINMENMALEDAKQKIKMFSSMYVRYSPGPVLYKKGVPGVVGFGEALSAFRPVLKAICYSFSNEQLDLELPLSTPPEELDSFRQEGPDFIQVPEGNHFITWQYIFVDGTKSDVRKMETPNAHAR